MTTSIEVSGRALIFDRNGNALILKRHPASTSNPGKWELPGGKPGKGESFEDSLRREVREETGFEIDIYRSVGTADQYLPDWHVIHVIVLAAIRSGGLVISEEHSEFRWVKIPEIAALDKADWFLDYYNSYLRNPAAGTEHA
ncbi:MAG TPA: NUDIX domain-containing protein [Methanoregulaceae archaeon]|nr:NUDIX domain-containing protein [Methanoregulaceae archaeon]